MKFLAFVMASALAGITHADTTLSCYGDFQFTREKNGSTKTHSLEVDGSFDLHLKNRKGDESFSEAVWEERLNGKTTNTRFDLTQDGQILRGVDFRDGGSTEMEYTLSYNLDSQEAIYLFEGRAKKKNLYLKKYFLGTCR